MDGTHAYIISDRRIVHHAPNGDLSIPLEDVDTVDVHKGDLGMTIFVVTRSDGTTFHLEIDAFNGAQKFGDILQSALKKAGSDVEVPPVPGDATTMGPQSS